MTLRRPRAYQPQSYSAANRAAARIILDDIEQYGEGSIMVRWARAVLQSHPVPAPAPATPSKTGQMMLPLIGKCG